MIKAAKTTVRIGQKLEKSSLNKILKSIVINEDDKRSIVQYKFRANEKSTEQQQKEIDSITKLPTFQNYSKVRFRLD